MRRVVVALLVPLFLVLASGAAAAARPAEDVRFLLAGRLEDPAITLVATGAITGTGSLTAESVQYRPEDNSYHEVDRARLGGGSLTLAVDGSFSVWPFTLDPRTCTQEGTLAGTWTVTAADGELAGLTGDGTFRGRFLTYAGRGPAGCDVNALKGFVAGSMTGTVEAY
jgi:hypothetical protein